MKPSLLSTWAICTFTPEQGMSTAGASTRLPLRSRVSMSEMGSVIMVAITPVAGQDRNPGLQRSPARFLDAGDEPVARHIAEANAADAELAIEGASPAA